MPIKQLLQKSRQLDLTSGSTTKNIWALALPLMLGNILQTAFNVVDMIWVGRLGADAIASVAMSGVVLLVIIALVFGLATGTQSLVARFSGARKQKDAEHIAMQSLIIGAMLSLVLAAIGFIFSRPILQMLGAQAAILENGVDYLRIILSGGLMMIYLFLVCAIMRAAGDVFIPVLIMIGATVLNIVLDPLMIFGIGFPRMGVAGAALATVLARAVAALAGLYILFQGHSRIRVHLARLQLDWSTIRQIIRLGFPNSIQMGLRSIVGLLLMAIVARYGHYAIAAYGIGLRVFSVVLMPGFALASSAATLVGQNLGARKFVRAQTSALSAAGFNSLIMGLVGILFFIFAERLISIFNAHPQVVKLGSEYLKITSFSYVFVALGLVFSRSLMGAGKTIAPMLISGFALLGIQIPLALLLPNHLNLGISGIWWAILISSVLQAALISFWFNLGKWRLNIV